MPAGIRLPCSFKSGTNTVDGRHGFEIKLPADYVANSSNSKKGTGNFTNGKLLHDTGGTLQLIPPPFATAYEAKPFYGTVGSGTQIPLLDDRDWNLDYFNGVLFQQDPPGTGDHAQNPTYVEAFLYIGDFNLDINSLATDSNVVYFADLDARDRDASSFVESPDIVKERIQPVGVLTILVSLV